MSAVLVGAVLVLVSVVPVKWATDRNYRRFRVTRENTLPLSEAVATVGGFLMLAVGVVMFAVGLIVEMVNAL